MKADKTDDFTCFDFYYVCHMSQEAMIKTYTIDFYCIV